MHSRRRWTVAIWPLICLFSLAPSQSSPFALPPANFQPVPDFETPPSIFRPKFRYWLPDASVPASDVTKDIADLAAAGGGGFEFLPFYNYGMEPVSTDWSLYGFGTAAFKKLFKSVLQTAANHSLAVDFVLGPNQGSGVPSTVSSFNSSEPSGLAVELVYGVTPLTSGQPAPSSAPQPNIHFNFESLSNFINAPELWGESELVALLAVDVLNETQKKGGTSMVILNETSIVDLTDMATNNTLSQWIVPETSGRGWQLMGFYQRYSNERSCVTSNSPSSWIGNGSWMVDHFSAEGAKKTTDFWDDQILEDQDIKTLLRQVGEYSWEDSMEMVSSLWWTPKFVENFAKARGYSILNYLPVLFQSSNMFNYRNEPYNTTYAFSASESDGGKYAEDYRLTLNEGYQAFLTHYQTWARGHGWSHSCQPAYNLPLDMAADIPYVGAPELESLDFGESTENYLQFTGAAHISGRNAISTEIGAQNAGAYKQPVTALLRLIQHSFAAGVNTFVIHGYPYSGAYPGTTWPGYTPFQYSFTEMWGPRHPQWRHINDTLQFTARNSFMLKTGVPRTDVAIYSWMFPRYDGGVFESAGELTAYGYTHEYIGADNLAHATAAFLRPDGPAYKALILADPLQEITPAASQAILDLTESGMTIIVVGSPPSATVGTNGQDTIDANMKMLLSGRFPNVHVVPDGRFSALDNLAAIGVVPRMRVNGLVGGINNASQLYSHWRSNSDNGMEIAFLLNTGPPATFMLEFGVPNSSYPFLFDAWTGTQEPIFQNKPTPSGIQVNITLAKEQSTIVGFVRGRKASTWTRFWDSTPNIRRLRVNSDDRLEVVADYNPNTALGNGTESFLFPNPLPPNIPTSFELGPWNLTVESWDGPETLTTDSVAGTVSTVMVSEPLQALVPWTQIPEVQHVSGVGFYETSFRLDDDTFNVALSKITGNIALWMYLNGTTTSTCTLRVYINGQTVPPFDPVAPDDGRDITSFLVLGDNKILIEVASTLFNAVKSRITETLSIGKAAASPRQYNNASWVDFGLLGIVTIRALAIMKDDS